MLRDKEDLKHLSKSQLIAIIETTQRIVNRLEKEIDDVKQSMYYEFTNQLKIGEINDYARPDIKLNRILKIAKQNANELYFDLNEDYIPNDEEGKIIELFSDETKTTQKKKN